MTPFYSDPLVTLYLGDCLEVMPQLEADSVDSIVTDPPYGLSFMGKHWDHGVPGVDFWREMYRVLKPGGYLLSFAGTRTVHRFGVAIEDAGFEIRDTLMWIYASGFPKSLDVSKALDKGEGHWRGRAGEVVISEQPSKGTEYERNPKGAPITDLARKWQGWGTALKPAHEPIVMARKPLIGTVAQNVTRYGTGALNIDGSRIPSGDELIATHHGTGHGGPAAYIASGSEPYQPGDQRKEVTSGRWPSNVLLSSPELFDEPNPGVVGSGATLGVYGDSGGYSRFFLIPKADRAERERGLRDAPTGKVGGRNRADGRQWDIPGSTVQNGKPDRANVHPTVKPLDLMRHLVRLVTPPGGVVLDPFVGSGTTCLAASELGFRSIGIEREAEYMEIAVGRLMATGLGMGL